MSIRQYKKHSLIPRKYVWDLDFLLTNKTVEQNAKSYFRLIKKLIKVKDNKYESPENWLEAKKIAEKATLIAFKLSNYFSNKTSQNIVDPLINKQVKEFEYQEYLLSKELGSESVRFFKNSVKLRKWADLPKFKNYRKSIIDKLETKKHKLSDEIEKFRVAASRGDVHLAPLFSILTNAELNYGYAISTKGRKTKITIANRASLAKSSDVLVRKTSQLAWRKAHLDHKESLANMLFQHFKSTTTWAELKKFPSTIDYLLFDDRVDQKLLTTLYSQVIAHKNIFKQYRFWHKNFYRAKFKTKLTKWDWARELVQTKDNFTIEEAQQLVIKSLKPMGTKYLNVIKKALSENWIDYMPAKNKRSGAYSIGNTYGVDKKLILMNFDGQLRSVETLSHELGHSMHSYFSDLTQGLELSQYSIFVAEIASIFNELMLYDHLLKTSKNIKLKFKIHQKIIIGFIGTVLRQVEWSNFEFDLYNKISAGEPVATYAAISQVYYKNSQKYSLQKKTKYNSDEQFMSVSVPHFYYDFYVYKYAVGQIVANIFFQKYKKEGSKALKQYIDKFLSAGSSKWPLELLKDAGVDLYKKDAYELAFLTIEQNITQWIKMGKEIFMTKKGKNNDK